MDVKSTHDIESVAFGSENNAAEQMKVSPSSWPLSSRSGSSQGICASFSINESPIRPSVSQEVTNQRWLFSQPGVGGEELKRLENRAKEIWSNDHSLDKTLVTSYAGHYSKKVLDERTESRPTSPTRRNNPHPPQIFMTTRLHYVNGFHNADTSIAREPYKMDASVSSDEQLRRLSIRDKFRASQKPAALNKRDQQSGDKSLSSPARELLPLDMRYSKISQIPRATGINTDSESGTSRDNELLFQRFDRPLIGSLHRIHRYAGPKELEHWNIATQSGGGANTSRSVSAFLGDNTRGKGIYHRYYGFYGDAKQPLPYLQQPNLIYQPSTARGDYSIHPQWPITLKHHQIPMPVGE